jgi:hypothetical protein
LLFCNGMEEIKDKFGQLDVMASWWSTCAQPHAAWRLL